MTIARTGQGRVLAATEIIPASVGISRIRAIQCVTAVFEHVVLDKELGANTGVDTVIVAEIAIA